MGKNEVESKHWKIWSGKEIEGDIDKGVETVFIRECELNDLNLILKFERIWFCEEFKNWGIIRECLNNHSNVNVSVYMEEFQQVPSDIKQSCRLYLKIKGLKQNDIIGVGENYYQEFFTIGSGEKVAPQDYSEDIFIK